MLSQGLLGSKYLRDIESVKTEKFKVELDKFLELIPDEPKMPNYVTNSIRPRLSPLIEKSMIYIIRYLLKTKQNSSVKPEPEDG